MLAAAGVPDQPWQSFTATGTPTLRGRSLHRLAALTVKAKHQASQCAAGALPCQTKWTPWMSAPVADALKLQRPLPHGALRIAAQGLKEDEPALAP
jgi:hypothetical protein